MRLGEALFLFFLILHEKTITKHPTFRLCHHKMRIITENLNGFS